MILIDSDSISKISGPVLVKKTDYIKITITFADIYQKIGKISIKYYLKVKIA